MKRGTPRHPKVAHLAELLGVNIPTAVGYLELLWHFTAEFAPQGDIGKYDDKRIAAGLHWPGRTPSTLIEALTKSGWIDLRDDFRLLVHDWHDHADGSVIKRLQRSNLPFLSDGPEVTGQRQTMSESQSDNGGLPEPIPALPEPVPVPEPSLSSPEPHRGRKPADVQVLSPLDAKIHETARAIHDRHPAVRRCGVGEVSKALAAITKRASAKDKLALLDTINENHREWCACEQWTKDGGEFSKGLDNWLAPTKERYLTQPEQATGLPVRQMSKSERSLVEASQIFSAMQRGREN